MNKKYADLDGIFHPQSVAVVGVSKEPVQLGLLRPFVTCGFPGPIYPVHRDGGDILGLKVYRAIKDIPGSVDYVVFGTPAAGIPSLLEECAARGVKAASFFTAGFGESGTVAGKRLQDEILKVARSNGIRLIGPNCLGFYCPASRVSFIPDPPLASGPVGFISQSGGHSVFMVRAGEPRGLTFSKVISYGNAVDIDESELLEYLAGDPETAIIGAYIEGIRDGATFQKALRKATLSKPVIVMKGGATPAGARTSASHTGALAGQRRTWEAVLRKNGATKVDSVEEMVDLLVAFRYLRRVAGKRAGLVGWGGGASVQAADECQSEGLVLPPFPQTLRDELASYWMAAGSILGNPVDSVAWSVNPGHFRKIVDAVARWEGIDILILHMGVIGGLVSQEMMLGFLPTVVDIYIEAARASARPAAIVLHSNANAETCAAFYQQARKCWEAGIPVFDSFGRAARAINRYAERLEDSRLKD